MLCSAMNRRIVKQYIIKQLPNTLQYIGIDSKCIESILDILSQFNPDAGLTQSRINELISQFHTNWEPHLTRVYRIDYENRRWKFIKDNVVKYLHDGKEGSLGRCLDIGCGRGCITSSLLNENYASSIAGIDTVDYSAEWHERRRDYNWLSFRAFQVKDIGEHLSNIGPPFDTIFFFYVLHHSNDYWGTRTLLEAKRHLSPNGRIVVLEDSLIINAPKSEEDEKKLGDIWKEWVTRDTPYCLSVGFDIQVVLDFVAVHLLAGLKNVSMPCNYKLGSEWESLFKDLGLKVIEKVDIGFKNDRDIDVPQGLFVLTIE